MMNRGLTVSFLSANCVAARSLPWNRTAPCSGYFNFGIRNIDVIQQRSPALDTIILSACLVVGENSYCQTQWYGQHGPGEFGADILFTNIPVAPNETVTFSYLAVNDGHNDAVANEYRLSNYTLQFTTTLSANITTSLQNQLANEPGDVNVQEITNLIGNLLGRKFGTFLNFIAGLTSGLEGLFLDGCDGVVAGWAHAYTGAILCQGPATFTQTDTAYGQPDESLLGIPGLQCNMNQSQYQITWFIESGDSRKYFAQPGASFSNKAGQNAPYFLMHILYLFPLYIFLHLF